MKRRFTRHELFVLRNEIPIQLLIEKKLEVPSKTREGKFRFLSPCCGEFNTGVKLDDNVARCFRCEKRFNTIEITKAVRDCDFVSSVHFLQKYHSELFSKPGGGRSSQAAIRFNMGDPPEYRESCNQPLPIKSILEDMTAHATFNNAGKSDSSLFSQEGRVMVRIQKMESEITRLAPRIIHIG